MLFEFKNKKIVLISPQKWGDMHISKHHYAIELASRGNEVYFVNPADKDLRKITIEANKTYANLFIVSYGFAFLNQFKFRLPKFYDKKVEAKLLKIIKLIKGDIDIFWSFDLRIGKFLKNKQSYFKIAHPVDFTKPHEIENAQGADLLISVAQGILNDFKDIKVAKEFINHGVSEAFIDKFKFHENSSKENLKFGYIGNLLRFDIDHQLIIELIKDNPKVNFIFYGNEKPSNISGSFTPESKEFIDQLRNLNNVVLKGVYHPNDLVKEMDSFDGFFLCYDKEKDVCKGTNYHKVMEYLSTGRVAISNHVETYDGLDLVQMPKKDDSNSEILNIFKNVITNIEKYNSQEQFEKRRDYAKDHTYIIQVDRIEKIIQGLI